MENRAAVASCLLCDEWQSIAGTKLDREKQTGKVTYGIQSVWLSLFFSHRDVEHERELKARANFTLEAPDKERKRERAGDEKVPSEQKEREKRREERVDQRENTINWYAQWLCERLMCSHSLTDYLLTGSQETVGRESQIVETKTRRERICFSFFTLNERRLYVCDTRKTFRIWSPVNDCQVEDEKLHFNSLLTDSLSLEYSFSLNTHSLRCSLHPQGLPVFLSLYYTDWTGSRGKEGLM